MGIHVKVTHQKVLPGKMAGKGVVWGGKEPKPDTLSGTIPGAVTWVQSGRTPWSRCR